MLVGFVHVYVVLVRRLFILYICIWRVLPFFDIDGAQFELLLMFARCFRISSIIHWVTGLCTGFFFFFVLNCKSRVVGGWFVYGYSMSIKTPLIRRNLPWHSCSLFRVIMELSASSVIFCGCN